MRKISMLVLFVFSVFTLASCQLFTRGTDEFIEIINSLDEYSSDFSFKQSEYEASRVYGSGKTIIVDEDAILAMYSNDDEFVTMDIYYEKNGTNILIHDLYIEYVNIVDSQYMGINYDSYDDSGDPVGYNAGNFNDFVKLVQRMNPKTFNTLYQELK